MLLFIFTIYKIDEDFEVGKNYTIGISNPLEKYNISFNAENEENMKIIDLSITSPDLFREIRIGDKVIFKNCSIPIRSISELSLRNIKIPIMIFPTSLTTLSSFFAADSFIDNIDLSKTNVDIIPNYAFADTKYTKEIGLPKISKLISEFAFLNCVKLSKISIPHDCDIDSANSGFYNCSELKTADLSHAKISKIPRFLFANCFSLENVILPEVQQVGEFAFLNTKVSAEPLQRIKNFDDYAFAGILSHFEITLRLQRIPKGLLMDCENLQKVSFSKSVEVIEDFAFKNCISLRIIEVPENSELQSIGIESFQNTKVLEEVSLLNTKVNMIYDKAFMGSGIKSFTPSNFLNEISDYAFSNSSIEIFIGKPELTRLHPGCFMGSSLSAVDLRSSKKILQLPAMAFKDCLSLELVYLPANDLILGASIFENCISLASMVFAKSVSFESKTFYNCTNLQFVLFSEIKGMTSQFGYHFAYCSKIRIIGGVNSEVSHSEPMINFTAINFHVIKDYSFMNCTTIKTVILGPQRELGDYLFWGCSSLNSVDLSKTAIQRISTGMFLGCTNLKFLYLPPGFQSFAQFSLHGVDKILFWYCGRNDLTFEYNALDGLTEYEFFASNNVKLNVSTPNKIERCWDQQTPSYNNPTRSPKIITDNGRSNPPEVHKYTPRQTEKVTPNNYSASIPRVKSGFGPSLYQGRKKPVVVTKITIIIISLFFVCAFLPSICIAIRICKNRRIEHIKDQNDEKSLVNNSYFDYKAEID